jgi:hypothetical protein
MINLDEWVTPAEALETVSAAMGGLDGHAANKIIGWIDRGRLRTIALEREVCRDPTLPPSEDWRGAYRLPNYEDGDPYEREWTEEHPMTPAEWAQAAKLGFDEQELWDCSTVEHQFPPNRHPRSGITYAGIRFSMADLHERMKMEGWPCSEMKVGSTGPAAAVMPARMRQSDVAAPACSNKPGRPNQSDEGVALHLERLAQHVALSNLTAESRIIKAELERRHAADEAGWSIEAESIAKAIRSHRKRTAG